MTNAFRYVVPADATDPVEVWANVHATDTGLSWSFTEEVWDPFETVVGEFLALDETRSGSGVWTGDLGALGDYTGSVVIFIFDAEMRLLLREVQVVRDGLFVVDQARPKVELNTHTGGFNELRVVDEDGVPVEGAEIRIFATGAPADAVPLWITATDADGRWLTGVFVNAGSYRVHVQYPGAVFVDRTVVV